MQVQDIMSSFLPGPDFNLLDFVDKLCRNSNLDQEKESLTKMKKNNTYMRISCNYVNYDQYLL